MPPFRTMPPAKAIKTERTHEENQERAYIAASRRSDRSLEARVESARRASEIHKRRTGRSLRVTEQDVINEEMYEEEDDDMPRHYKHLSAHLQTGNPDFNRRLSAYLTSHVAVRSAVEHAVHNTYNQQFGMVGAQYPQSMYPSPMLAHQAQQNQQMRQSISGSSYRHAPYPTASSRAQHTGHQRSASLAVATEAARSQPASPVVPPNMDRRMSLPVRTHKNSESPKEDSSPSSVIKSKTFPTPSFPPGSFSQQQFAQYSMNTSMPACSASNNSTSNGQGLNAANLNVSAQLNLSYGNPSFGLNDSWMNNMMAGSEFYVGNSWPSVDGMPIVPEPGKQVQNYPSVAGLNSTLAPAEPNAQVWFQEPSQGTSFFDDALHGNGNSSGSNNGTPFGNEFWADYINADQLEAPSSQQSQIQ